MWKKIRNLYKRLKKMLFELRLPPVIHSVLAERLTYLDSYALSDLYAQVESVEKMAQKEGILIEAGCALGGSAIVMATAKSKERLFYVYDVFGMIPPPSESDGVDVRERYEIIKSGQSRGINGGKYYGYENNLYDKVTGHFREHNLPVEENNISLVKGLFESTLWINEPVLLAHLDCDWYEAVMICLIRIEPQLVQGGILIIDDYDAWSGCRKAVDQYFDDKKEKYEFVHKSRLHIIRK
jgi:asparagine synthase (glutamine-hydrolysing)